MSNIKKELKKALGEVKKERKGIKEFSMFGANNWVVMDEEIGVLEKILHAKDLEVELRLQIAEVEEKIEKIEDLYSKESEYEKMNAEREPYQTSLGILLEIKSNAKKQ